MAFFLSISFLSNPMPMQQTKSILLFIAVSTALFFTCCKKTDTASTQQQSKECVVGRGSLDGTIIPGQYIISYKSSAVSTKRMSAEQVEALSEKSLERHSIKLAALEKTFGGDAGGFVAKLSDDEVAKLKA